MRYECNYFANLFVSFRFVAAKSMYFGVGGGTQAFLKCVSDSGLFDAEIVHAIKEGNSVSMLVISYVLYMQSY